MTSIDERDFYKKEDLENSDYFKFPRALLKEPQYRKLNDSAKILYAYMYDRLGASLENEWFDDAGRAYIKFSIKSMMIELGWGNKKCGNMMEELEKVGLIIRVRPNRLSTYRIYVRKVVSTRCQNDTSRDVETTSHEMSKRHTIYNNSIYTNSIYSATSESKGKKKKQFNSFPQREQDMRALEDAWLNRSMKEADTG